MAEFINQVQQLETLLTSNTKSDKSLGYSTLLHLQEQSTQHPSVIDALSNRLRSLLMSTITDILDEDEEISTQALKCLGFTIYHPSLVSTVPEDIAHLVVESLAKLITTTKIKAVCNLGVWCISIQQFNVSYLAPNFHSLLRAVIHALDNPSGSLSTTYEALQAVTKLVAQLSEKMRDASNIWAPVIYRRLLTRDKKERDMTERCLLKIQSIIFPPSLALSKALVADMKKKLLPEMKEAIQDHGRKVHTVQAWGWYIRILGSYALKNRQLVNDMLKIPEQTFTDTDPQVQIASQVAWEGLIDALIHSSEAPETKLASGPVSQRSPSMTLNKCSSEKSADGLSKSLRLIMTPLMGIMSSNCDVSVRSSCLNTWCYLLHKLDLAVNHPPVVTTVVEPMLEVVFQMRTDDKKTWLWNFCLDLLDDFISSNNADSDHGSIHQVSCHPSTKISLPGPHSGAKCYFEYYPIKWLPWDLSKLDLHLKLIHLLISPGSVTTLTPESRSLAWTAALRVFRSVLKGIQKELKKPSITHADIMSCLNRILSLTKQVCDDATSKGFNDLIHTSLHFIEAIREEIEPSLLVSPLYSVVVDIEYIKELQSVTDIRYPEMPEVKSITHMDMVSPAVYLTILHLYMVAYSVSNVSLLEITLHEMKKHLKFILLSHSPLDNLYAIICLLYKHREFAWLKIWAVITNSLKEHIDANRDPVLEVEMNDDHYVAFSWFLSYPFVVCLRPQKLLTFRKTSFSSDLSLASSKVEPENIVEAWKSFYGCVNCYAQSDCSTMTVFPKILCSTLNKVFTDMSIMCDGGNELSSKDNSQNLVFHFLFGEVAVYLLNQLLVLNNEVLRAKGSKHDDLTPGSINNILEFVARYLTVSVANVRCDLQADHSATSRVFSALASLVGCLRKKHHILLVLEIFSDPLVQWFSTSAPTHKEIQEESINHQLQLLWSGMLDSLERSQPSIVFDSSFLKVHAQILEKALDHPNSAISESTITFWNNTYGNQFKLDYPQSLVPVLDKLSRNGRLNIQQRNPPILAKASSRDIVSAPSRYRVAAKQNRISKRIGLTEDNGNDPENTGTPSPSLKRKRLELTEHQKEVRRAQQGRARDCSGHGPGIRTYTSVDFSQGNEDSQSQEESQELRNTEAILELLRKAP